MQRDPVKSATNRLKYATLIAAILMFVLILLLPNGISTGSDDPTEGLERDLERMLQVTRIGLAVTSVWFAAVFGALRELSAAYTSRVVVGERSDHV